MENTTIDRPESLQKVIDKEKDSLKKLESVQPDTVKGLEDALDKCGFEIDARRSQRMHIWADTKDYEVTIHISLNLANYTDMGPLLKELAKLKWKRIADKEGNTIRKTEDGFRWELEKEDTPFSPPFRIPSNADRFICNNGAWGLPSREPSDKPQTLRLRMILNGFAPEGKSDGEGCRKVHTGDYRRYPIYEVICT